MVTFGIGAGLAATAGALVGPLLVVEPHMGGIAGLKAFAVVIMGGMGSIPGAIFAALILGMAENLAAGFIATGLKDLIAFTLMILILVVKPSGLWSRKAM
jgi:branched-chain amino acid transport system permease protein